MESWGTAAMSVETLTSRMTTYLQSLPCWEDFVDKLEPGSFVLEGLGKFSRLKICAAVFRVNLTLGRKRQQWKITPVSNLSLCYAHERHNGGHGYNLSPSCPGLTFSTLSSRGSWRSKAKWDILICNLVSKFFGIQFWQKLPFWLVWQPINFALMKGCTFCQSHQNSAMTKK